MSLGKGIELGAIEEPLDEVDPSPAAVPETGSWRRFEPLGFHPVLEGALHAFAEHGYHGASMRTIANRLGITVPAIYYHYENKQDLLVSLMFTAIDDLLERARAALDQAGEDPDARLCALTEAIVLYEVMRRDVAFLDSEIRSLEQDNREAYIAKRDELEEMLINSIVSGCRRGSFATKFPLEAGRALLAMFQGVASWYRPDGPLSPQDIAERYTEFALGVVRHQLP